MQLRHTTFNRTNMELKPDNGYEDLAHRILLIAPIWN